MLHSDAFSAELEALGLDSSIFGAAGIPAPIFQALVPRAAGILDGQTVTYGTGDSPGVFTRASTALYRDSTGVLRTASANAIRAEYDAAGAFLGYPFEPAATSEITRSTDIAHADWTKSGTASIAASAITAPDGSSDAETITDPGGSLPGILNTVRFFQIITAPDDSTDWTASIYIAKTSATPAALPMLNLGFLGGTAKHAFTAIDPSDGSTGYPTDTGVPGGAAADSVSVEDCGLWWRLSITFANNSSGNVQALFRFFPAATSGLTSGFDATLAGSADVWQADLVNAATESSPMPTAAASATRAVDDMEWAANPAGIDLFNGFCIADVRVIRPPSDCPENSDVGVFGLRPGKFSILRVRTNKAITPEWTILCDNTGGVTASVEAGNIVAARVAARWEQGGTKQCGYDAGSGFVWGTPQAFVAFQNDNQSNIGKDPDVPHWIKNVRVYNRAMSASEIGRIFAL